MNEILRLDRKGKPIDLHTWAALWGDPAYQFVRRDWLVEGRTEVVTVWEGFEPYRVEFPPDDPPQIFHTALVSWAGSHVHEALVQAYYHTEEEALAGHEAILAEARRNAAR